MLFFVLDDDLLLPLPLLELAAPCAEGDEEEDGLSFVPPLLPKDALPSAPTKFNGVESDDVTAEAEAFLLFLTRLMGGSDCPVLSTFVLEGSSFGSSSSVWVKIRLYAVSVLYQQDHNQ